MSNKNTRNPNDIMSKVIKSDAAALDRRIYEVAEKWYGENKKGGQVAKETGLSSREVMDILDYIEENILRD